MEGMLSLEEFKKLNPKRQLAYYKKYRRMRYSHICGCCGEVPYDSQKKEHEEINKLFDSYKEVLDNQPHVNK